MSNAQRFTPERKLWVLVIRQAIQDALSNPDSFRFFEIGAATQLKIRAISWLRLSNRSFLHVCDLAGLEPSYVLRIYRKAGGL